MKLELNGIDVTCIIGDLPEERTVPGRLTVDAALEVSDLAAETDSVGDTADYVAVAEAVRAALVKSECRLIERAARVACGACLSVPNVYAATVRVTKAGSVPHLKSATAEWRGEVPSGERGGFSAVGS